MKLYENFSGLSISFAEREFLCASQAIWFIGTILFADEFPFHFECMYAHSSEFGLLKSPESLQRKHFESFLHYMTLSHGRAGLIKRRDECLGIHRSMIRACLMWRWTLLTRSEGFVFSIKSTGCSHASLIYLFVPSISHFVLNGARVQSARAAKIQR